MKKIHFKKTMQAPVEKVWDTMFEDETYRQWTRAFTEGSHFKGSWEEDAKILFLDADNNGMVSTIAENRRYQFISIKHIGIVNEGEEDTDSDEALKWAPAFENYSFSEKNGETTVTVDMDVEEEYEAMFNKIWPEALNLLKNICEK